jgi:hypothetical protein
MRPFALIFTLALGGALAAAWGCGSEEEPVIKGGSAGASSSSSSSASASSAGGAGGDGGGDGAVCDPAMGSTPCDACVYGACCAAALACEEGTPCDGLWSCARAKGCLDPGSSDFDGCAVSSCPSEATDEAMAALIELATCIKSSCGAPCGG